MYSSNAANLKRKMMKYVRNNRELMREERTPSPSQSQMKDAREQEMSTA